VAGMLPLALGNGPGAEERRCIAVLVIGGQSLALFLTLIITPVAYSYFEDLRKKKISIDGRSTHLPKPDNEIVAVAQST
jgi:Cu/Ag efflux pump CusA